jgi:hypothetical protein
VVAKRRDTDSFEIAVCKLGAMEVPQTLSRPVQLLPHFSGGCNGESEATYQFQSVDVMVFYILNDIPMRHPL